MIGEIGGIDSQSNLPVFGMFREGDMQINFPIYPGIHGKVSRKTQAVRRTHIVLQDVHVRIGESRMDVHNGTDLHFPREPEYARSHHAMRCIGGENAGDIRPDHGNREQDQCVGKRIEVAFGPAPRVGEGEVRIFPPKSQPLWQPFRLRICRHVHYHLSQLQPALEDCFNSRSRQGSLPALQGAGGPFRPQDGNPQGSPSGGNLMVMHARRGNPTPTIH